MSSSSSSRATSSSSIGRGGGGEGRGRGGGGRGGGGGRSAESSSSQLDIESGMENLGFSPKARASKKGASGRGGNNSGIVTTTSGASVSIDSSNDSLNGAAIQSQQQLSSFTSTSNSSSVELTVRRPGYGRIGRAIKLAVNCFGVKIPDRDILRYDVKIQPHPFAKKDKALPKPVCRSVVEAWKMRKFEGWTATDYASLKAVAYDGQAILLAPKALKGITDQSTEFLIELAEEGDSERKRHFALNIKQIKSVQMEVLHQYLAPPKGINVSHEVPNEAVSALEILLRSSPSLRFTTSPSGRCFYNDAGSEDIQFGLSVHFGYNQSLRFALGLPDNTGATYHEVLLNLDLASTAFYQHGPLVKVVLDFFGCGSVNEWAQYCSTPTHMLKLERFLKGVNIDITYRASGRLKYKIFSISKKSAAATTILMSGDAAAETAASSAGKGKKAATAGGKGREISIAHFFKTHHNIDLQFPQLPCICVGAEGRIMIPMECCIVRNGQRYVKKLNETQQAQIVKITAVSPPQRRARTADGLKSLHGSNDEEFLQTWGLKINQTMTQVAGRVLEPPQLCFGARQQPQKMPVNAEWRFDKSKRFAKAGTLVSWSVAVFGTSRDVSLQSITQFLQCLSQVLIGMDCVVNQPKEYQDIVRYQRRRGDFHGLLQEAKQVAMDHGASASAQMASKRTNKRGVDLVLCILPNKVTLDYNEIKRIAETQLGIVTQCCVGKHVRLAKLAYVGNLILKINAKLGGVNTFVDPPKQLQFMGDQFPTLILGADVTHPAVGSKDGISIAAVVGSIDKRFAEYRSSIRVQQGKKEVITDLEDMIVEILNAFKKRSPQYSPKRMLFYRDGVSEGQFGEVMLSEIPAIKRAFIRCRLPAAPTLTFVIVSKRHHIRFFPLSDKDMDPRSKNVLAGTVVDTGVAHPYEFDFFLNSHPGLQGTSRSAHYHVLFDENKFSADQLQDLTYKLCYLFCRCSKSVSLCTPVYYAHLLAARARSHTGTDDLSSDYGSEAGGSIKSFSSVERASRVLPEVADSMFYV